MALIRAVAEGEGAEAWAEALAADWAARATPIKRQPTAAVWRARIGDRDVVIKTWALTPRRRAQSALLLSPAWRHWRGARRLRGVGIATARPLAIGMCAVEGRQREALVIEAIEGPTALEALAKPLAPAIEAAAARAIGAQVRILCGAGILNRDHKPSNLILAADDSGSPAPTVIDCVGLRRTRRDDDRALARMLGSLVIEPTGCGVAPRLALRWRVLRAAAGAPARGPGPAAQRARVRRLWGAIEQVIVAHGDPAPRINPLAEAATGLDP